MRATIPEVADEVAYDLVGRVKHVTTRYGNQRRAERAALERVERCAKEWGYSDEQAARVVKDTLELAALRGYYRDE